MQWYIKAPIPYNKEETDMDHDRAEIIAINCLSFIAGNEKYLGGYLNLSGTDLNQLKENIANPEIMPGILASLLDYLLQNEKYLIEYAEEYHLDPKDIQKRDMFFPVPHPIKNGKVSISYNKYFLSRLLIRSH